MNVRLLNRFFLLLCAPCLGMLLLLAWQGFHVRLPDLPALAPHTQNQTASAAVNQKLEKAVANAGTMRTSLESLIQLYDKTNSEMNTIHKMSGEQAARPQEIFDSRISVKLGKPVRAISSNNIDLKLYTFNRTTYTGYALKVNLKTDNAMKMVLGKDRVGGSETTLDAVKRYGAVAGINAGGFADDTATGKRFPLSTTVYGGKYVYGFEPTFENLAFVGLSTDRKLIGGRFSRQEDLDKLKPDFGATFVPVLLKSGTKQQIPAQWQNSPRRAPRTVVGNFGNDQLLFIVTDGYDEKGGSGATLMELQDMLQELKIVDAYNLDGGGSSSLIVEGRTINRPSDGRLRPLPTHFLFFK
ncbi:phosphodiester glycosidase family protein [Paenibacillus sp. y28]|uniref:phosphodiester glycosidase family protein n=1 Tax=Paenibacillus sp. y28 TaxID=3129110 RepID=UPI00301A91ED